MQLSQERDKNKQLQTTIDKYKDFFAQVQVSGRKILSTKYTFTGPVIGARDNADAIKEKQDTVADFDEDLSSDVVTPQQIQIKVDQKDAGVSNSSDK